MRRSLLIAVAASGAGGCLVGTLDLAGFACDTGSHPCASGYSCVIPAGATVGSCVAPPSGTSGSSSGGVGTSGGSSGGSTGGTTGSSCAPPTCAAGGGVLLCDGGVQPCGNNLICDYGKCVAECAPGGACAAGFVCDTSVNGCVPTNDCSGGASCTDSQLCLGSVCTPPPPPGGAVGTCNTPGDAGMVVVEGPVAIFPNANGDVRLEDGGTVTFFSLAADGGLSQVGPVPIVPAVGSPPIPSYSITVPAGSWTALVKEPGFLVPTYFPGLQVVAPEFGSNGQIALDSVVELDQLPAIPGVTPQPGHVFWVGRGTSCGGGAATYLAGYTVGLSPAAPDLGYIGDQFEVIPGATSSSASPAEFLIEDAAYATTQFTLAINAGAGSMALLSGTFVPPPYVAGQTIAVALTYPNFTQ